MSAFIELIVVLKNLKTLQWNARGLLKCIGHRIYVIKKNSFEIQNGGILYLWQWNKTKKLVG